MCVCFLEVVFLKSICLYLWEKYGWEHSIEMAEIFESESEDGFHVVLTSSLSICMYCGYSGMCKEVHWKWCI